MLAQVGGGPVALALLSGCGNRSVCGDIGLVAGARVLFIPAVVMVGEWGLSCEVAPKGAAPFTALIVDQANGWWTLGQPSLLAAITALFAGVLALIVVIGLIHGVVA